MSPTSHSAALAAFAVLLGACGPEPTESVPAGESTLAGAIAKIAANPSFLQLYAPVGASKPVTISVQSKGVVAAASSNTGCATVSPASQNITVKPPGSMVYVGQFTVSPVAMGSCVVSFTTRRGDRAAVEVVVGPRIAYSSNFNLNGDPFHEVYLMDPDGANKTRITVSSEDGSEEPAWSPNRTRIAFVARVSGEDELFLMDANGQNQIRLTTNNALFDMEPAFSPDGSRIAFSSDRSGPFQVYAMDGSGLNVDCLTCTGTNDSNVHPTWSPDGFHIAYQASFNGGNEQIWVMEPDGSHQIMLTGDPANWDYMPAWSPDGARIAFMRIVPPSTRQDIWVMNADGSNQMQITSSGAHDSWPAWSPDGGRIAFISDRDGNQEIYVMNADGSNQIRLTKNDREDIHPAWR